MKTIWIALGVSCLLILLVSCVRPTPTPTVSPISPVLTPVAQAVPMPFRNGEFNDPYTARNGMSTENVAEWWNPYYSPVPLCMPGDPGCPQKCPSSCGICTKSDQGCWYSQPEWGAAKVEEFWYRIHGGSRAQKIFCYGRQCDPSVYQQIDVAPGLVVTFSVWMMGWQCYDGQLCLIDRLIMPVINGVQNPVYSNERAIALLENWGCTYRTDENGKVIQIEKRCRGRAITDYPANLNLQVGIDTVGGILPTAASIVWTTPTECFDVWCKFSVTATAAATKITLWMRGNVSFGFTHTNNDIYIDDATLEVWWPYQNYAPIAGGQ